ncbi:HNH endonuclease [Nocardioides sp. GY 10113]|uniref:HNH endonuclease family protein n=1 Tax=Nocardioides sp. GY 10113 TaxID=2569761 RepID=UPI0010A9252D|nr:HNH endonuclease family protein [Nocardioides sp. GY 10113]TIC88788.1 HNH endonuclease [Nocardioides sp. GY 10113]
MGWQRAVRVILVAAGAGVALTTYAGGCSTSEPGTPGSATTPVPAATRTEAAAHLDGLGRVDRHPRELPDYRREAFGRAWADLDGNGCNQRDDVLVRDAVRGTTTVAPQGSCDHDVLAGTWIDPYTGATLVLDDLKDLRQAQAIQIDHVVPLAEAWRSGAAAWSADRREAYANDLGVLLAVDGPTNAAKGDDDPASWRPRQTYQCEYAVRWVTTKYRWGLAADASEVRALREMLDSC